MFPSNKLHFTTEYLMKKHNITWRTLQYYRTLGIIPKPNKIWGTKQVEYPPETSEILGYVKVWTAKPTLAKIKEMLIERGLIKKEEK